MTFGLQLPELLGKAKELHVRVDFWAFPSYTKIHLLRQREPGRGSWDLIVGWTFRGLGSAEALERALLHIEARVQNFETRNVRYREWIKRGCKSEWQEFETEQAQRYIIIPEPEGAS